MNSAAVRLGVCRSSVAALAVVVSLSLAACGSVDDIFDWDCDNERGDLVADLGQPQDIDSYTSSGYNSMTYWYWFRGFARTFRWGSNVSDGCEISDYRFTPIGNAIQ